MPATPVRKTFLWLNLKQWLWLLVGIPGGMFAGASLFIAGYSSLPWPTGEHVKMTTVSDGTEEVVVLVHGKGDSASSWADGFAAELEASILSPDQQAVTVEWGEYSNDLFRCTLNARRIGRTLGEKLSEHKKIKRLHLIGHSAGSFVVYGICEKIKELAADVFIQTTYLDPVSIYGGMDWGYGKRNFGNCADISDAYLDHEDGVPGSDEPLDHPHTFDVTALKKTAGFTGLPHLWPISYYREAVLSKTLPYWRPEQAVLLKYPPQQNTSFE